MCSKFCSLTYNVPFCQFERSAGVQTGKGDQVEGLIHGVVHTYHTDIPTMGETHTPLHHNPPIQCYMNMYIDVV